jgi:hypothetical protein
MKTQINTRAHQYGGAQTRLSDSVWVMQSSRGITVRGNKSTFNALIILLLILCSTGWAETDPKLDPEYNTAEWGDKSSSKPPIKLEMSKDDVFSWTDSSKAVEGQQKFQKDTDYGSFKAPKAGSYTMYRPLDNKVTDLISNDTKGN